MRSQSLIEIDIPQCTLTYGTSPCTAVLGTTGHKKCFNSRKTCQDLDHYTPETKTLLFSKPGDDLGLDVQVLPSVKSVTFSPSMIDVGTTMGTRATMNITFEDHPTGDGGLDPYIADRSDPYWRQLASAYSPDVGIYQVIKGKRFLAVGEIGPQGQGGLSTSNDGENWIDTDIGFPIDTSVTGVAYGNDIYVAVGGDISGETPYLRTSPDGLTWEDQTTGFPGTSAYLRSVCFGEDLFVAGGPGSSNIIASADGETWTLHAHNITGVLCVAYGGGNFLAAGDGLSISEDGTTWVAHTSGFGSSLILGAGYGNGVWIIVGQDGKLAKSTNNGSTWSLKTSSFGTSTISAVAYGADIWIAVGTAGKIAISEDDGETWIQAVSSFGTNTINGVSFIGNSFYACGTHGTLAVRPTVRTYNPFRQGTFWGKFRARYPYIRGLPIRSIQTVSDVHIGEITETRNFLIESSSGPQGNIYTLQAKDILKMADGDRAQCPLVSNGQLASSIDDNDLSLTLEPSGIGNAEYPASGWVAIGSEIVSFTRSGDTLTIVRGQLGTEATSHDEEDLVQIVAHIEGSAADILNDLLTGYADIDPAFIPLTAWETEVDTYISRVYEAYIAKPTAVSKLINEIIEQAGLVFWFDEETQLINLQALRPVTTVAETIVDADMLQDSFTQSEQQDKRVAEVWTRYNLINPLEDDTDEKNFASCVVEVDADTPYEQSAIKKVFSRWIAAFNRPAAERLNSMILSRFSDPPRKFHFSLFRGNKVLKMGQGFNLETVNIQDDEGGIATVPCIVTSINPMTDRYEIDAEEMLFVQRDDTNAEFGHLIVIDVDSLDVNLREAHDSIYAAPDDTTIVTCVIEEDVYIGASSTSKRAFDVGQWPEGMDPPTIINHGHILGHGGIGGYATSGETPQQGQDGGTALYARFPIHIDNQGAIGGGGGGGGQAGRDYFIGVVPRGIKQSMPGGGGAGELPGTGKQQTGISSSDTTYNGQSGTRTTGGNGGVLLGLSAGKGGDLGESGEAGQNGDYANGASGGNAGKAIDGVSFVTFVNTGEVLGPQIN